MPYIKEICKAGKTIEIRKYFTYGAHPKGEKRKKRKNESPDRVKRANQRNASRKLRRLMNHNFQDGDYLVRMDFCAKPKGSEEMQKEMQNFIRRLRTRFKKADMPLKYIYVKEVGAKGSRHIHMMMNKCEIEWIRSCWKAGAIHIDPLYSDGQYAKIADYFIKYAEKTEMTEGQLIGKRWYASQNLLEPKVTKTKMAAGRFSKTINEPKGYYLDKSSISEGVSELTGFEYFSYTFIRLNEKRGG